MKSKLQSVKTMAINMHILRNIKNTRYKKQEHENKPKSENGKLKIKLKLKI